MRSIADILESHYSQSPRPLIVDRYGSLTHADVSRLSGQIATELLRMLDVPMLNNRRVLIALQLDRETVLIVLALLRLGATYVPLDPKTPSAVARQVLEDVGPVAAIVESKPLFGLEQLDLVTLEKSAFRTIKPSTPIAAPVSMLPTDLAYIAYTSGTTSAPKGVMMPQGPVVNFVEYVIETFQHGPNVISLCRTPPSFDPFLTEVLPSMASGGTIAIQHRMVSTRALLRFIAKHKVSNFGCGPSLLAEFVKHRGEVERLGLESLQEVYVGYEDTGVGTLRSFQALLPGAQVINGYGTTETFAASTFYSVPHPFNQDSVPIGRPIDGVGVELVDPKTGADVPDGGVGELLIRGVSLMRGYLGDRGATDAAFVDFPLDDRSGDRAYRTGDLFRRESGELFFVGRLDNQIKVRGYRVEPEAIARAIESMASDFIEECAVVWDGKELACCFVERHGAQFDSEALEGDLRNQLEDYRIPRRWVKVEWLPRNDNSKIDHSELLRLIER